VRRYGEATFPVDVVVKFADGKETTEHWDGKEQWRSYVYDQPSKAVWASVDPGRVLLLDINYTNNSMSLMPNGDEAATKWSTKWLVWLEDHLLTWAFFV